MSSDNYILIKREKKEYFVYELQAEQNEKGHFPKARCKSLEEATKYAQKYQEENICEYGIHFDI